MIPVVSRVWTSLASTDAALPWVLLPTILWLVQWAFRSKWPAAWQWAANLGPTGAAASKAWQALPSVVIGSVLCASATGLKPSDLALAAVVSCGAPVWHEVLKWLSAHVPAYQGGNYPAAGYSSPPPMPPAPPAMPTLPD